MGDSAGFDISGRTGLAYVLSDQRLFRIDLASGDTVSLDVNASNLLDLTIVP